MGRKEVIRKYEEIARAKEDWSYERAIMEFLRLKNFDDLKSLVSPDL